MRLGLAISSSRALFALVGMAGEDDLDAPDLHVAAMSYAWVTIVRGRLLADLSSAAIWSGAVVRNCVGASSVARLQFTLKYQ